MTRDMRSLVAEIRVLLRKRHVPPHHAILKYDRNQPRGAAGTPQGGRWVKGVSQGTEGETKRLQSSYLQRNQASYADIMDAPMGEGFHNRPRGVNIPEPPPDDPAEKIRNVLSTGSISDSEPMGDQGANVSKLVTLEDGTQAVFKPEVGETWRTTFSNRDIPKYITNREFSLAEREATAYEVSEALGVHLVPVTVLRETVEGVEGLDDDDESGFDSDELKDQYNEYRDKRQEEVIDEVGEEMYNLFDDHLNDLDKRVDEVQEIWDKVAEEYPNRGAAREHPVLPMGSVSPFERKVPDPVDPLELLKEADVDPVSSLLPQERKDVEAAIRKRFEEGAEELGAFDRDEARDHETYGYDKWLEAHQDTEVKLYDKKIKSFDSWAQSQGYDIRGHGRGPKNPDAPHPKGGSFQHFQEGADSYGDVDEETGPQLAVLDYVLGTMDRHHSNLMFKNGRPIAIDNGYSFPGSPGEDDFKFRSNEVGTWLRRSSDTNVPEALRATLHKTIMEADWQGLVDRHPSMSDKERKALLGRVDNMKRALRTREGLGQLWRSLDRI